MASFVISKKNPLCFDSVNLVLKKALLNDCFVIKTIDVYEAGDGLLGFLGDHYKIKVSYVLDGRVSELQLFLKTLPKNNAKRAGYNTQFGLFEREIYLYNEIFSRFKKEDDSKTWRPRCYFASGDDLVFEDLHFKGFKMQELRTFKDKTHTHVTMKALARFHSASILLVERKTTLNKKFFDLDEEFGKDLGEACFTDNEWFNNAVHEALFIAGESKKYGKNTIFYNKIKLQWEKLYLRARNQLKPSEEYCNVIVHSDLWNNNIMYRYDNSGNPVQCIFVDYQSCRICPPAADAVAFFYLNLDKKLRDDCFEEFLKSYYEEVTVILKENHIDIKNILPWNSFFKSCEEYRLFGLAVSTILYQFVLMDENDIADILKDSNLFDKVVYGDRKDIILKKLGNDEVFCKRMMDNIEELIEMFIIQ